MAETENALTFTKKVKNELAALTPESKAARKTVLSGLLRLAGVLSIGSKPTLSLHTELAKVAKFAFNSLKTLYGVIPTIVFERKMHFDKSTIYVVKVEGPQAYEILADLKVKKDLRPMKLRSLVNREHLPYFARGLFMAGGSINDPSGKSYFLALAMEGKEDANIVCQALVACEGRFAFKVAPIRDKWIVYLKKSSQIAEFLAWLGAQEATLAYENARAAKDYFNNENRLNICYVANYAKTLKTGEANIADVKLVLTRLSMNDFDSKTQAVIASRLRNKDYSYSELAQEVAKAGVHITKSGVARVFAKIRSEARTLKGARKKISQAPTKK